MLRLVKRIRDDQRGADILELALVLPILLLLVMGGTDLARAFYIRIVITNAAREGARYASHFPHVPDGIRDAVINEAAASGVTLQAEDIFIRVQDADGNWVDYVPPPGALPEDEGVAQSGEPIFVGVEFDFETIIGDLETVTGSTTGLGSFALRSGTVMIVFGITG
jgi:hypothetical protein